MGHFIGLQHNIKDPSVMAPHLRINQSERSIYPADANKVLDRYQSMPVKTMETPTILGAIKSKTKIEIAPVLVGKCRVGAESAPKFRKCFVHLLKNSSASIEPFVESKLPNI